MDRHDPQLAKLQDSFITHLVTPLAQAMNDAGLLPLPTSSTETGDQNSAPKSELLTNLECNQKYWKAQLGEVQEEQSATPAQNTSVLKDDDTCGEMETIQEQDDENGSSPTP